MMPTSTVGSIEAIVDAGRQGAVCCVKFAGVGGGKGKGMAGKNERRGGLEEQSVPAEF